MDMIQEVKNLIDQYNIWLADKTRLRQINDTIEITTPYLDRHNDYLQIYVQKENGGYLLTDESYIITDLIQSGCNLQSKKRRELLTTTLNGFGVRLDKDNLITKATANNFHLKKHNLLQAMLAINDMFYLSYPVVASLFLEDVTDWAKLKEIRYITNVKFTGGSGYDHVFDFVIPHSRAYPDRFIRAISRPTRETAESYAWAWVDTKECRPESKAFAFLNDMDAEFSASVSTALQSYDITPVCWTERESYVESLSN
jgi:hypothetical protein